MNPEAVESVQLVVPARIADLGCRLAVPRDWQAPELPPEEVDFNSPEAFFPLALVAAPWAAIVMTIAARPAFEDGTVQDWSLFLLNSQGIRPSALMPGRIGNLEGLVGIGRQEQEGTWLENRFAFFEDGGRLLYLGLFAPEAISSPLEGTWQTALRTFALDRPQGQTVPLVPGLAPPAARVMAAVEEAAEVASPEPETPEEEESASSAIPETELGFYAKSGDLATLDPEHPVNARLRDQGIGFVPNIIASDLKAKTATIGAGAIAALLQVALGWHVNDDGRRTLLLDPAGKIQISMNLVATNGRSPEQILDEIEAEAEQSYPHPEFSRFAQGGIWALRVGNIAINDEAIVQVHLLTAWAEESMMVRTRITADGESMRFAMNYAQLMLESAKFGNEL
jgi:hypothetical protein